jgi:hypothetical protein
MSSLGAVRLFEIEPGVARFLAPDERTEAQRLLVPMRTVPKSSLDVVAGLH